MKNTALALLVIVAVLLLMTVAVEAAGVRNVNLSPVGDTGVSGMATTIVGDIAGPNPYHNVQVNIRMDRMPPQNSVYEGWLVDNDTNTFMSLGAFQGQTLSFSEQLVHFVPGQPFDAVAVSVEQAHDPNPAPGAVVARGPLPGNEVSRADFQTMAVLPETEMFQRQIVMERYNLTRDQWTDLRMQGWSPDQIALVANIAVRCNRPMSEVASMVSQGQTWEQIARACNTTTAMLFQPAPAQAVAGFVGELGVPPAMAAPPIYYRFYPNNRPVVDAFTFRRLHSAGFTWREIAVAANIAARTGESVSDILRMTRLQGLTFRQIALERGLDPGEMLDVSEWPFGEEPGAMMMRPGMQPGVQRPYGTQPPPGSGF